MKVLALMLCAVSFAAIANDQTYSRKHDSDGVFLKLPHKYSKINKKKKPTKTLLKLRKQKMCMTNFINNDVLNLKLKNATEAVLPRIWRAGIDIHFSVDNNAKKMDAKLKDALNIKFRDINPHWCTKSHQQYMLKHLRNKIKTELAVKLPEKLIQLFEKQNQLEQFTSSSDEFNKVLNEIEKLKLEVLPRFKFNEVTGLIYYSNGEVVQNKRLKKMLYPYFYEKRNNGDIDHIVDGGILHIRAQIKGEGEQRQICAVWRKRSIDGKLEVLEKDCKVVPEKEIEQLEQIQTVEETDLNKIKVCDDQKCEEYNSVDDIPEELMRSIECDDGSSGQTICQLVGIHEAVEEELEESGCFERGDCLTEVENDE